MNAVNFVRLTLEQSKGWILGLAADMKDAPLTAPTPNGGNHPLWVLGHLTFSEADLIHGLVSGEPNPLAEWKDLFGQGSEPTSDASLYPSFDEIMGKFEEVRANTLRVLDGMTDDDLDEPSHAPEEMKDFFGTNGQVFATAAIHFAFHGGQIADARRAAGRPPLMA